MDNVTSFEDSVYGGFSSLYGRQEQNFFNRVACAKDTSDSNHDSNNSESKHSPNSNSNHGNNNSSSNHGRRSRKSQPAVTARSQAINPKNPSTNAMIIQARSQDIPIIPARSLWQ
ncbi:hypothetical protein Peur_022381 [Populus x canadensis]